MFRRSSLSALLIALTVCFAAHGVILAVAPTATQTVIYLAPTDGQGAGAATDDAAGDAQNTAVVSCTKGQFLDAITGACAACTPNCEECQEVDFCARCEPGFYRVLMRNGLSYCSSVIPRGYLPELQSFYAINTDVLGVNEPVRGYAFAYSGKALLTGLTELPFEVGADGPVKNGQKVRVDVLPCKKMCRECSEGYAIDTLSQYECVEIEKCFPIERDGVTYCSDPSQQFLGKIIAKRDFGAEDEEKEVEKKDKKDKKDKKNKHKDADAEVVVAGFRIGSLQAVTNRDKELKQALKAKNAPPGAAPVFYRWTVEQTRANGETVDVSFEIVKKGKLFDRSIKLQRPSSAPVETYTVKCHVASGEDTIVLQQQVVF